MNEILNKFLLAGDQFMPKMHIRQPGFRYILLCVIDIFSKYTWDKYSSDR